MSRVIHRRPKVGTTAKFLQFLTLQAEEKVLKKRREDIKTDLTEYIEEHGETDDKGHLLHSLETPLQFDGKSYSGFMKQRRVSTSFNEEVAEERLRRHGVYDEALSTQVYIDQDKVYRLQQEGRLPEADLDAMFEETVTWAFVPVKE